MCPCRSLADDAVAVVPVVAPVPDAHLAGFAQAEAETDEGPLPAQRKDPDGGAYGVQADRPRENALPEGRGRQDDGARRPLADGTAVGAPAVPGRRVRADRKSGV